MSSVVEVTLKWQLNEEINAEQGQKQNKIECLVICGFHQERYFVMEMVWYLLA